jgi:formamidopyrimidine-DNA glycosylase
MPELPEVETMRRGILTAVGSTIVGVEKLRCSRKPILLQPTIAALRRRIVGRKIAAVDRLGKRVVVRTDSNDALIFEPRMTGLVLVGSPPTHEHLRFRLDLAGGPLAHVWYWDRRGLGSVRLLSAEELSDKLGESLGPDALSLTAEGLRDRLARSRRPIKVALLDQKAVAGIGNLYASEILHLAGVSPLSRCDRLTAAQWQRIHDSMHEVLLLAIRYEGSTLSDGTYRNALNETGGYQNHHRVYDRAGKICPTCKQETITRIVQAQRSTFYCRACQTSGRSRK